MKVLIIEDEAPAFRRLQKILEESDPDIEIIEVIDSVEEAVKWFRNHESPHLIFMDIQLNDGISFEIFDQVKVTAPVIFTTAFDEYMLKAFKVNSIDYLLKPIRPEDLAQSLEKYKEMKMSFGTHESVDISTLVKEIRLDDRKFKSRFLAKLGDKLISIETDDVAYFQSKHGVVHLVTQQNKKYLLDLSLDEVYQELDPEKFYRANRQFIVRFKAIAVVHRYHKGKLLVEMSPKTDEEIIVSAEKSSSFKSWLDN